MKTIKKLMFLFVFFVFASCLYTGVGVYAKDAEGNLSLHERTKIYSANNSDYFEGCEDFNDYRFASPAITVLTHGYGGNSSHWSNNYYGQFVYQEESLITKIVKKSNADGMSHHITYYYWNFIGWYDQSGRCFRFENGMIGYKE